MAAIYVLTCNEGRHYIGVTTDAKVRIRNHLSGNGSKLVKEALEKGASFTHEILLENSDVSCLYLLESDYIKKYKCREPHGYNIDKGGHQGGASSRIGSKNTQAILTENQVLEIRYSFIAGSFQHELAEKYGVSRENISAIVVGKSWKNVGGPRSYVKKPRAVTNSDIVLFKKGRAEGLTYQMLADKYNRSPATIRKYCLV